MEKFEAIKTLGKAIVRKPVPGDGKRLVCERFSKNAEFTQFLSILCLGY